MIRQQQRVGLRLHTSLLALAIGMTGVTVAISASAQESVAPADEPTEVVVVGTRAGLKKAAAVKRDSDQFVDSVIADDIGKLPDVNVAESLQRVSGVQIKRSLGEGTQVSIRGLTQNITLVNGRDVVDSAGRGGSGVDSLGTGSYGLLAQLPSEIIQRLDVTKLAASSDIEGALSGTVNIITAKPLDSKTDTMAFSVEGLYNDRAAKGGDRTSILFSHHFSDKLAGLINISQSSRNIRDESIFSFSGYVPLTGAGAPSGAYYLADIRDTQINENRKRTGINATLQWKPTENIELLYDLLYSKQDINRDRWWFALPLSSTYASYTNPVFSSANTLMAGTLNAQLQTNTETYDNTGDTLATGLTGTWKSDRLKVTGDASYSRSKQDGYQHFLRLTTKTAGPIAFDFRGVDVPQFTIPGSVNLTDPTQWNFTNYFDNRDTADSELSALRLDADYRFDGPISHLKFGARASDLDVEIVKYQSQLTGNISADTVPDSYQVRTLDILSGASGYSPRSALYPVMYGGGKAYAYDVHGYAPGSFTPYVYIPLASFSTTEKDTAYYVQADIDTTIGGLPLSGNVGIRQVETDFTAVGSYKVGSNPAQPLTVKKSYSNTLPSASFKLNVRDDLLIRFGAAKVIARPNSADQNPGLNLATVAPFTATAGNAELDPFKATQYDLSAEYYFKPGSVLSLGLFKKDLQSFIIRRATTETYNGIDYLVTRPYNGADATIDGMEFVYQDNFDFLPAPFDGLGVAANVSIINSDTGATSARTGEKIPVPGLSKNNLNLVVYYEKAGYGVRVAYNKRDQFLDQLGAGGEPIYFDAGEDLSISGRMQLNAHYSLDLQISNVLDSPIRKYGTEEVATSSYALNGRTFSLALRGKF